MSSSGFLGLMHREIVSDIRQCQGDAERSEDNPPSGPVADALRGDCKMRYPRRFRRWLRYNGYCTSLLGIFRTGSRYMVLRGRRHRRRKSPFRMENSTERFDQLVDIVRCVRKALGHAFDDQLHESSGPAPTETFLSLTQTFLQLGIRRSGDSVWRFTPGHDEV